MNARGWCLFFAVLGGCAGSSTRDSDPFSVANRSLVTRKGIAVCKVKKASQTYVGYGEDIIEARNMARNACQLYHSGCTDGIVCEERSGSQLTCAVEVSNSERTRTFHGVGNNVREAAISALLSCRENIGKNGCAKITEKTCTDPNPISSIQRY